jgi:hypothetical protein
MHNRAIRMVGSALPAACCALVAHALLYGSLAPHDGVHGYFGWYEPLVAALTLAAGGGAVVLLAVALAARLLDRPIRRVVAPVPFAERARTYAGFGLLVVLVQESVERSVETGRPTLAAFTPAGWALLSLGLTAAAAVLAAAVRLAEAAASFVCGAQLRRHGVRPRLAPTWSVVTGCGTPPRPLAARRALRAPPLPVV